MITADRLAGGDGSAHDPATCATCQPVPVDDTTKSDALTELDALLGGPEQRASESIWDELKRVASRFPPVAISTPRCPDDFVARRIADISSAVIGFDRVEGAASYKVLKSREPDPNAPITFFDYEGSLDWEKWATDMGIATTKPDTPIIVLDSIVPDYAEIEKRVMGWDLASGPDRTAIVIIGHSRHGSAARILAAMGGSIIGEETLYVPLEISCGDPDYEAKMANIESVMREASVELFGGPRRSAQYKLVDAAPREVELRPFVEPQSVRDGTPRSPKQTMRARQPHRNKGRKSGKRR